MPMQASAYAGTMDDDTAVVDATGRHVLDLLIARDGLGMHDGLAAPDRLTLFRTNTSLAVAVLQQALRTTMRLGGMEASAISPNQTATAMQLAGHAAPRMVLAMHGCFITPTPALWQRITTLSLLHATLTPEQVTYLSRLTPSPQYIHTLRMEACTVEIPSNDKDGSIAPGTDANGEQGIGLTASSAQGVGLTANSGDGSSSGSAFGVKGQVAAVNGRQRSVATDLGRASSSASATCIISDSGSGSGRGGTGSGGTGSGGTGSGGTGGTGTGSGTRGTGGTGGTGSTGSTGLPVHTLQQLSAPVTPLLHSKAHILPFIDPSQLEHLTTDSWYTCTQIDLFPNLQRLTMTGVVGDVVLRVILTHPHLTHVTLGEMELDDDHSQADVVSVQELHVLRGCDSDVLTALPLAKLQRCVVYGELTVDLSQVMVPYRHKVVCRATLHEDDWDPTLPSFRMDFIASDYAVQYVHQILAMCTRELEGALTLAHPPADILSALPAALPAHITTLCFRRNLILPDGNGSLINHMPDHVQHVVFSNFALTAELVYGIVTGITRPIKITFHDTCVYNTGWGDDLPADQALIKFRTQIQEWLSEYENEVQAEVIGHVQVL